MSNNIEFKNLYLLFGTEPLLILQSTDKILSTLKQQGFENKLSFDIDSKFDFSHLNAELVAGDLFASKKIIKLNIPSWNAKISKAIEVAITDIKDGVVIVLITGKLTLTQQKSNWFKIANKNGLAINHKEIYPNQMLNWVIAQMQELGLAENKEVAKIIAENNEGNLLSAFNEMQKIKFSFGESEIDTNEFIKQNKQNSIYTPYSLIENALLGEVKKVITIFNTIKIDSNYLCILLYNQVKQLINIHLQLKQKISLSDALKNNGVWDSKTKFISPALTRHTYPVLQKILLKIGRVERSIKGMDNKNITQELLTILLTIAGVKNGLN